MPLSARRRMMFAAIVSFASGIPTPARETLFAPSPSNCEMTGPAPCHSYTCDECFNGLKNCGACKAYWHGFGEENMGDLTQSCVVTGPAPCPSYTCDQCFNFSGPDCSACTTTTGTTS